ncbi:MAG: polyribonucleotide nucleotidyltransferase [Flavobacteriales bacterium TMED288]|nr:polyribonucleotide nucleotidyltransferase [Flavobacteriales bacterium]RPG52769.1 MAG: polyribonucleotide nucleotidyltransferase [Flavobacteriales bacterium TMED288]|tara:strand:- start:4042 stop:6165 length:2124 start_codon:yes stop_codon:yes gene_type:complete
MVPKITKQEIDLGNGKIIQLETGKLAKQANGSVVVKMGKTMLLASVVSNKDANEDMDFLPLTVDYREKFAADGRYPGGFLKREARPSDQEILVMRLVDRVLRPLFPKDYHSETQIMIQLMSYEKDCMPDALAGLAASACLTISDIPFKGPISEARVVRVNGKFIINPSLNELEKADIDLIVGASIDSVTMVEGEMHEVSEKEMLDAIKFAHKEIIKQCKAQLEFVKKFNKNLSKREYDHEKKDNNELFDNLSKYCYQKFYDVAKKGLSKDERKKNFSQIREEFLSKYDDDFINDNNFLIKKYFSSVEKKAVRSLLLSEGVRLDGRSEDQIRPIWCEIDYLPSVHGSAIFTRGETQSLSTVTLGTALDVNRIDNVTHQGSEKFYLHYNFPPFSTGEARPIRGVSRREIGHGNLAQRALKIVIPENNPYTVRIVSEILESNGSSSMATVCAGTLALMDAGIKITKPVSGIAMGLIKDDSSDNFKVLSDILGDEDHLGDMDFKVTGTENGITACQMDIKITGLSYEILEKALLQAKKGREAILKEMLKTISSPRENLKPNAPKIEILKVEKDCIGAIIGPGGKIIQGLQEETETTITIEEIDGYGKVEILGTSQEGMDKAISRIKQISFTPVLGEEYEGKVKNIQSYGAFVEISPGKDGLLHISEISWERTEKVEDVLQLNDSVKVKIIDIDQRSGKMKFSRKQLIPKPN